MTKCLFVGGPLDGHRRNMSEPVPMAWNAIDNTKLFNPTFMMTNQPVTDVMPAIVTYAVQRWYGIRRRGVPLFELAVQEWVYFAPGHVPADYVALYSDVLVLTRPRDVREYGLNVRTKILRAQLDGHDLRARYEALRDEFERGTGETL